MADYSLVPVDYQPDFGDISLVPVDHDPFAEESGIQQAQAQPVQSQQPQPPTVQLQPMQPQPLQTPPILTQPPASSPQPPEIDIRQPVVNAPAFGNGPSGSGGGNAGSDPNKPALDQGTSSTPFLFPGYADPTPTMDRQPVSSGDRGPSDIHQKIVDLANSQIGSGAWDFKLAKGNFGKNTDKCNLFAHDVLADAGATPGLPEGHWWWKRYPPTAADWADPAFEIPRWRVLSSGEAPQPGDVVGQRIQWPNGATGHVMIVGPNANFIGVGPSEKVESVASKMMGQDRPGGLLVYRRYEP